jgi:hypothetical protein
MFNVTPLSEDLSTLIVSVGVGVGCGEDVGVEVGVFWGRLVGLGVGRSAMEIRSQPDINNTTITRMKKMDRSRMDLLHQRQGNGDKN